MAFTVRLTDDAARDLREIVDYTVEHRGTAEAQQDIERIEQGLSTLADSPERGAYPKELLALGMRQFREILLKPYRVIYTIEKVDVFVLVVADGRRDFRALLERRLLEQ